MPRSGDIPEIGREMARSAEVADVWLAEEDEGEVAQGCRDANVR